jgi:hypothetical protein
MGRYPGGVEFPQRLPPDILAATPPEMVDALDAAAVTVDGPVCIAHTEADISSTRKITSTLIENLWPPMNPAGFERSILCFPITSTISAP